jgi:hypothetical protein
MMGQQTGDQRQLFYTFSLDDRIAEHHLGLTLQPGRLMLDCSANGDIAALAGNPVSLGRDGDGLIQPMTLFFRVQGVDDATVEDYVRNHPEDFRPFAAIVAKARAEGRFPAPRKGIGLYKTLQPGVWRINTSRVLRRNGTDVHDLTAAELEGREQTMQLLDFFRSDLPGFENCSLLDTAATIGVRETRRIVGDYTLTLGDLQNGRRFDDVIALCGYPVDIHAPDGTGGRYRGGAADRQCLRDPLSRDDPARPGQRAGRRPRRVGDPRGARRNPRDAALLRDGRGRRDRCRHGTCPGLQPPRARRRLELGRVPLLPLLLPALLCSAAVALGIKLPPASADCYPWLVAGSRHRHCVAGRLPGALRTAHRQCGVDPGETGPLNHISSGGTQPHECVL